MKLRGYIGPRLAVFMIKFGLWMLNRYCFFGIHYQVVEGGGAHFGDDLLTCTNCGAEGYELDYIHKIRKDEE